MSSALGRPCVTSNSKCWLQQSEHSLLALSHLALQVLDAQPMKVQKAYMTYSHDTLIVAGSRGTRLRKLLYLL